MTKNLQIVMNIKYIDWLYENTLFVAQNDFIELQFSLVIKVYFKIHGRSSLVALFATRVIYGKLSDACLI